MTMQFDNQNETETEVEVEQSQGVIHQKLDQVEPPKQEAAELPKDDVQEEAVPEPEQSKEEPLFDLLGDPIESESVKKKQVTKPAPKVKAPPKEPEKFGTDYRIAYARFIEILPKEDMTLDEVREWLEVDFPELSKERTKMDVDKDKKTIVPMVLGAKKG